MNSSSNYKQDNAAGVYKMVIVVHSYGVFGWCMRALRTLFSYHISLLSALTVMFIVVSVHALLMLLFRVRTKLTKLVSVTVHHFKLNSVAIIHC
jgi:hypothetical protein